MLWRLRGTNLAFLLPAVLSLLLVGLGPIVFAVNMSLRRYHLARPAEGNPFIGLQNYAVVVSDPSFWEAMLRTGTFLAVVLPFQVALGLAVALLLHRPGLPFLRALTRVALVVPLATTPAVVGLVGRLLFNREAGVVNYGVSLFGLPAVTWLGDPTNAFVSIVLMELWQWTPFVTLVFLAGLTAVPSEIEDAARLETNRWFDILRHVQLPYLLPGLTAVLILRTADILKLFDMVFTMTRGGPGAATELISLYVQRIGFRVFDQGVASAQAIILLVLCIVLARLYIRVFYREVSS
jgi:multiple sugar transport system permease protein